MGCRINNSQVAVPGLPGGYGTFTYGINVDEELICYVRDDWAWRVLCKLTTTRTSPLTSLATTLRQQ
jgi:hypothetical protein